MLRSKHGQISRFQEVRQTTLTAVFFILNLRFDLKNTRSCVSSHMSKTDGFFVSPTTVAMKNSCYKFTSI